MKTFSLDIYTEEEIFVFIGQPVQAKHPLCNIKKQHEDQLLRSLVSRDYYYTWEMMSVALQTDDNLIHASAASMLDSSGFLTILRDSCVLEPMSRRYRCPCVLHLSTKSDTG